MNKEKKDELYLLVDFLQDVKDEQEGFYQKEYCNKIIEILENLIKE